MRLVAACLAGTMLTVAVECGPTAQPPSSPTATTIVAPPTQTLLPSATPALTVTPAPATVTTPQTTQTPVPVQASPIVIPPPPRPEQPGPVPTLAAVGGNRQSPVGGGDVPDRLIEAAKQDLARKAGVPVGEISVVSTAPQEWRDSSLGCPQPGGMYAQVITPGYLIRLQAGESQYEYHTDSSSRIVACQSRS